jgi:putative chitinase
VKIPLNALLLTGANNYAATQALEPMNAAAERFQIDQKAERLACFIANTAVESGRFKRYKEDLFYRRADRLAEIFSGTFPNAAAADSYVGKPEKLANKVYANRYGNGNEASGDGWKYRGRGYIQLTFKDNYREAGLLAGRPYLDSPDLLLEPPDAAMASGAFWEMKKLNALCDAGKIADVTRLINKGMIAAQERQDLYRLVLTAFN